MLFKLTLILALMLATSWAQQKCKVDSDCPPDCFCLIDTCTPLKGITAPTSTGNKSRSEEVIGQVKRLEDTIWAQKTSINGLKKSEISFKAKVTRLEAELKKHTSIDEATHTKINIKFQSLKKNAEIQSTSMVTMLRENSKFIASVKELELSIKTMSEQLENNAEKDKMIQTELKTLQTTVQAVSQRIREISATEGQVSSILDQLAIDITAHGNILKKADVVKRVYDLERLSGNQAKKISDLASRENDFLDKINKLKKAVSLQRAKVEETKAETAKTKGNVEEYIKQNNVNVEVLNQAAAKLKADIGELKSSVEKETERIKDLTKQETATAKKVGELESAFNEQDKELKSHKLKERVTALEKLVDGQGNKITNLEEQEKVVTEKLVTVKETLKILKDKVDDKTLEKQANTVNEMLMEQAKGIKNLIQQEADQMDRIKALEEKLKAETGKIDTLTAEGKEIADRVTALEDKIVKQAEAINKIAKKEIEILDKAKNLKGGLEGQASKLEELTATDKVVLKNVDALESLTGANNAAIEQLNGKVGEINGLIKGMEANIEDVSKELNETEFLANIKKVTDGVQAQAKEIQELMKKKAMCAKKSGELEVIIETQGSDITVLQGKDAALKKRIDAVTNNLKEQSAKIDQFLKNELGLRGRVEKLEKTTKEQAAQMEERIKEETKIFDNIKGLKAAIGVNTEGIMDLKVKEKQTEARIGAVGQAMDNLAKTLGEVVFMHKTIGQHITRMYSLSAAHAKLLNAFSDKEGGILEKEKSLGNQVTSQEEALASLEKKSTETSSELEKMESQGRAQLVKIFGLTSQDADFMEKIGEILNNLGNQATRITFISEREENIWKKITELKVLVQKLKLHYSSTSTSSSSTETTTKNGVTTTVSKSSSSSEENKTITAIKIQAAKKIQEEKTSVEEKTAVAIEKAAAVETAAAIKTESQS